MLCACKRTCNAILGGKMDFEIPGRGLYTEDARKERVEFLRKNSSLKLEFLENTMLASEELQGNIENYIGAIQIPVGLAGPLEVELSSGRETLCAPIATTEGALVASISRGARAFNLSGGMTARFLGQKMIRAPMFELSDLEEALDFGSWLRESTSFLRGMVGKHSNYAVLEEIEIKNFGKTVNVRFVYNTKDAAGQNMTTICTWHLCNWILKNAKAQKGFQIKHFLLEGGLATDKKASFSSMVKGRGAEVVVEGTLKGEILERILKVSARELSRVISMSKSATRIQSGQFTWNVNVANVIAGIFAATGQDMACVHESSFGELHLEEQDGNLYCCLYIPSLVVGIVGGGTRLGPQREMLGLVGCTSANKVGRLAEIIASFALALELSTSSSIVAGDFAQAHNKLGRTNASRGLKQGELDAEFFNNHFEWGGSQVVSLEPQSIDLSSDSLVMEMSSQVTQKLCGFFQFRVGLSSKDKPASSKNVLLKVKPADREVLMACEAMAGMCGDELFEALRAVKQYIPFHQSHVRELSLMRHFSSKFSDFIPEFLGEIQDPSRDIFILAQEKVSDFVLAPSSDSISKWNDLQIKSALQVLATIHARSIPEMKALSAKSWMGSVTERSYYLKQIDFMSALSNHAHRAFSSWYSSKDHQQSMDWLKTIHRWAPGIETLPHTLIHHDFNPRNVGVRKDGRVVALDWELAHIHIPQRDVVEFLSFVLNEDVTSGELQSHLKFYQQSFESQSGITLSEEQWRAAYLLALKDFSLLRVGFYAVANSFKDCDFLPHIHKMSRRIFSLIEGDQ